MAYAAIELLMLNFTLNPPFRQTLVLVAQLKYTKICIKIGYFVNLKCKERRILRHNYLFRSIY